MSSKQVVVVRADLKMRAGKFASQIAHACMKVFFDRKIDRLGGYRVSDYLEADEDRNELPEGTASLLMIPLTPDMSAWVNGVFTKIVLGVNSEADLLTLYEQAKAANLPVALVTDNGATEFHGVPTHTAIAIGPADADAVDKITRYGSVTTRLM